jgi:pilus assembly protein FimV
VHAFDAPPAAAPAQQDPASRDLDDAFAAAAATEAAHQPMSFDQHFADAMTTAQPVAPAPAAEPVRTAEDDHTLDFDLGGLSFEPVSNEAPPLDTRDAKEVAAAGDVHDLEFDMGAFEPAAFAAAADATAAAEPAPQAAADLPKAGDEPLDFSFDMDFDAPAANPVPQPAVAAEAAEPALDDTVFDHDLQFETAHADAAPSAHAAPNTEIDMANLAREFDLPDLPTELHEGVSAAPEQVSPATELKDPLFDLDTMDFGQAEDKRAAPALEASLPTIAPLSLADDPFELHELPTATPAVPSEAAYAEHEALEPSKFDAHFDLPGFDLDLPGEGGMPLPEVHEGGAATAVETPAAALAGAPAEMTAQQMEMETKLDLAIAYQEIGDKEGARELLEEVIRGGNAEQAGRANAMRASLA